MFGKFDETILEKLLFYFFKMFGMATMKYEISTIKNEKIKKRRLFTYSKIDIVYNSFLILVTTILNIILVGLKIDDKTSLPNVRGVQKITDVVQFGFATLTCVFILVYFCARQKKAIEMADQICQIYGSMIVNNCDTGEKRSILLITLFVFSINFIFWLVMIITSVNVTMATPNNLIFYYLAVYSCHVIMQTLLMQYSIILNMIGYFFLHINKSLVILLKKPNQLFLDAQCRNIDKTRGERLLKMRKTYLILCKISEDISDFYSPLMFFCLSVTFVTLIRSGLYIAVSIADKESNLTIKGMIHCIGYVVHYYFLLVMLTKKASKIVTESKRTGEIVSDCVHYVDNQEIILNQFSNYLLHKKIKFTVFNLFVLDESLLLLFAGSMATYLVIMMDF
ncbi:gustatory receptor 33 [Nasonia vitripennis]|uniref:Gustatory receptor n=1 Tax=Nasonia vitripennis TaxID=7425 RepID=A0A7M6UMK5_NASVI|nr:gustatory receptor 33 [Nasonia vitripennis]